MRLNGNKVSICAVEDELNRLRNRLTTSKTERPEVIEESIFHISRFAKASMAELGSSRIRTLGLPAYLLTINPKDPSQITTYLVVQSRGLISSCYRPIEGG